MQLTVRNACYSLETPNAETQQNNLQLTYRDNRYFATSSVMSPVQLTVIRQFVYRGIGYFCCF